MDLAFRVFGKWRSMTPSNKLTNRPVYSCRLTDELSNYLVVVVEYQVTSPLKQRDTVAPYLELTPRYPIPQDQL
jgi:hypothetical protein